MKVYNEEEGIYVLNEGDFYVGLIEVSGGVIDLFIDEVIGFDFLKFMIDIESMEGLIVYL